MLFNYVDIPAILQYFEGAEGSEIRGRNIAIISWTCLLPLTFCIWTYLHPNIPSRNCKWDGLGERLKLMLLMVVAPELILIWAVRQFFAAREIMVTYNKERPGSRKWSAIHGHFLSMGGWFRAGWVFEIISFERFKQLLKDPNFKFPPITAADLEDKSKRGGMLLALTAFFANRFILQLLARVHQGLAVTQFELHTFALAIVSFIAGALWWDKPWNVKIPLDIDSQATNHGTEKPLRGTDKKMIDLESNQIFTSMPLSTSPDVHSSLSFVSIPSTIFLRVATTSEIPSGAKQVPLLYAPKTSSDKHSYIITFALFGLLFGGIHCMGWNFAYQTESEKTLWQFTTLAITIIPAIIAPIQYVLANGTVDRAREGGRIMMIFGLYAIVNVLLLIYVSARLSLALQTLVLLKKQPPGAFLEVDWSKYIPHGLQF